MHQTNPWLQFTSVPPSKPQGETSGAPVAPQQPSEEVSETVAVKDAPVAPVEAEDVAAAPVTGPMAPQPFVELPEVGLPVRVMTGTAALWCVGAHGGAGESTLAALDAQWQVTGHCWPELTTPGVVAPCVLLARTHAEGLMAAQRALQQWAASGAGASVQLVGLVLMADAPGRFPVPLRDLVKVIGGGAPRVWEVPWVEAWRFGNPAETVPRAVARIIKQINTTLSEQQALG